jgi:hypothetical protein
VALPVLVQPIGPDPQREADPLADEIGHVRVARISTGTVKIEHDSDSSGA